MVTLYTDGSFAPQADVGAWAALLFLNNQSVELSGIEPKTTQHRMELMAIIKAIDWLVEQKIQPKEILVVTDSQYAVGLPPRRGKLTANHFITRQGKLLPNMDLIQRLYRQLDDFIVHFVKVKAHQHHTNERNYNREVDIRVRSLLRRHLAGK